MSRRPTVPKYGLHKPSGQARVVIDGKHIYLGPHGSPASREAYGRVIAEHASQAVNSTPASLDSPFPDLSIDELLVLFLDYARGYYVHDGKPTKELTSMKEAMGHLRAVYASDRARDFGPKKLKAVRQYMIDVCDLSRGVVNARINRVKRIFKWAVSEEWVPPHVYEGLRTVASLRYGRTTARETQPIKPVPDAWVDAVLPHVSPQVAAMIELQRLCGMRPEEVTAMRPCDIDTSTQTWVYQPAHHKNRWRGHQRLVPLGPRAQEIVQRFLVRRTDGYLFSPQEAEQWRNDQRRWDRKTPMTPSQAKRLPKQKPKRPKRERYNTDSYRRAVAYGIAKANRELRAHDRNAVETPHWHPNQLRHSFGTRVRKHFGVEAAQTLLGQRTNVVEVYAEKNIERAIEIAQTVG